MTALLLLVPTAREARALLDPGPLPRGEDAVDVEVRGLRLRAALCGFGPAAAAALAALTLSRERPARVLLVGVGGTYRPELLPVGGVMSADAVCFGDLGAYRGGAFLGPAALGFEQAPPGPGRAAVEDVLQLAEPGPAAAPTARGGLVTVASASESPAVARARASRLPGALLEDMEGFGVALAAQRLGVPCTIVRSVSNVAGDSERSRWELAAALGALRAWLLASLPTA
jgi:futalosine hydrolase